MKMVYLVDQSGLPVYRKLCEVEISYKHIPLFLLHLSRQFWPVMNPCRSIMRAQLFVVQKESYDNLNLNTLRIYQSANNSRYIPVCQLPNYTLYFCRDFSICLNSNDLRRKYRRLPTDDSEKRFNLMVHSNKLKRMPSFRYRYSSCC
jgi:hypothetical protein